MPACKFQIVTSSESALTQVTVIESLTEYCFYAVRNCNFDQILASTESTPINLVLHVSGAFKVAELW